MWFSNAVSAALNAQIGLEYRASLQYITIAAYFDGEGLPQLAARYFTQAEEERDHALRLIRYVMDGGSLLEIPALPAMRQSDITSAEAAARMALDGEREVTDAIVSLLELATRENDHLTRNFLQWFVAEQREELASAETLLKMIQRAGESGMLQVEAYLNLTHGSLTSGPARTESEGM